MLPHPMIMMWNVLLCILLFKYVVLQEANYDPLEIGKDVNVTFLHSPTGNLHLNKSNLASGEHLWDIQPNVSHSSPFVTLFFTELFLHENDSLSVFKSLEDSKNDSNSLIEPIHSQNSSVTIYTDLPELVVKLKGTDHTFQRLFNGYYASEKCAFQIKPDVKIMYSPLYIGNKTDPIECQYTYNHDPHHRSIPVFLFDVFNFSSSTVELDGSTLDGPYDYQTAIEFLPNKDHSALKIQVEMHVPTSDHFRLQMHMVDSACSQYIQLTNAITTSIESPAYTLDNGTLGDECRWIIKHTDKSEILGVSFTKLDLTNVLDIISINNGANEISPPLLQVTKSNAVETLGQLIRSSGPYLWISFKPVYYASKMMANITVHGQGGYFQNQGEISMKKTDGNDTVFLLEVEGKNVVLLNMTSSEFSFPATLNIYNGFDRKELLTTIHNAISYPILSKSSRMMIIATSFSIGSFTASFNGVNPGCLHMSTLSDENYILSGNCNKTCQWIIPPQDLPEQSLLLNIQYISLEENDIVKIYGLGGTKTHIGTIDSNVTHVPQLMFSSATGVMVEVIRKQCAIANKIALIGHSSFIPVCGGEINVNESKSFQVISPLYPDTYPILANCKWNFLSATKDNLILITFINFNLAPDHCIKILNSQNKTVELTGSELPEDMFLSGNASIYFNSSKCSASKSALQLVSSSGFILNGTVAECGAILEDQASGEFTIGGNKSLCIWKVSVPSSENSVNIIKFTVTKSLDKGNYELSVFDGPSIREPVISNISTSEVWSKRNTLIFLYKRLNVSKPSSTFTIKYSSLGCNSSMLCDNKICLHPDWRCNGVNDCGDYTDERNCESLPINPETKNTNYSPVAFWLTFVSMLIVGLLLGFGIPILYRKYGNGQYHRFNDISVIE